MATPAPPPEDKLTPPDLKSYGVKVPENCMVDGLLDLKKECVAITLSHEYPESRILESRVGNVRIVSIVCTEYVVSRGDDFVCIDLLDERDLNQRLVSHDPSAPSQDGFVRGEWYRDRCFVDIVPPGPKQLQFRKWFSPIISSVDNEEYVQEIRRCRDLTRGAELTVNQENQQEYFNVTYEKDSKGEILCPLGYAAYNLRVKSGRKITSEERKVWLKDSGWVMGMSISKHQGYLIMQEMQRWARDPRPLISLDTFRLVGSSFSPEWKLCVKLIVYFSTQT